MRGGRSLETAGLGMLGETGDDYRGGGPNDGPCLALDL